MVDAGSGSSAAPPLVVDAGSGSSAAPPLVVVVVVVDPPAFRRRAWVEALGGRLVAGLVFFIVWACSAGGGGGGRSGVGRGRLAKQRTHTGCNNIIDRMGPYAQQTTQRRRPQSSAASVATVGSSPSLTSLYRNTLTYDSRSAATAKDTALGKIAWVASSHNPRAAGPAGLRAFDQAAMAPDAFRDKLRRSFNLHLTDEELAIIMKEVSVMSTHACPLYMRRYHHSTPILSSTTAEATERSTARRCGWSLPTYTYHHNDDTRARDHP